MSFPQVCYYCGVEEECLVEDEEMKHKMTEFAVVHPLCFLCKSEGKKPYVKMPRNSKKALEKNNNFIIISQNFICFFIAFS